MKSTLTSINPPHTTNIFNRKKGIEWRTKPMPTGKHYCYETKKGGGTGKVIGEYTVWRIRRYKNVSFIPKGYIARGCVPLEFLEAYSKGRPLYAHFITDPKRYDNPKELSEFSKCGFDHLVLKRPPQSWCYVEEVRENMTNEKIISVVTAADVISEKFGIPICDLVDVLADIPAVVISPAEYEIALFHFIREQMYIKNGFKLIMSDEEIDARTLDAMEKLRTKADSPRLRGQYLCAKKELK